MITRVTGIVALMAGAAFADGEARITITPANMAAREAAASARAGQERARGDTHGVAEGVLLRFEDADLASEVLPELCRQAGIEVRYEGAPRNVTIRLAHPVRSQEALDLVCRFAGLHHTRNYLGQIVLREGYGGRTGSVRDLEDLEGRLSDDALHALEERQAQREEGRARSADQQRAAVAAKIARIRARTSGPIAAGFSWNGTPMQGQYAVATPQRGSYARGNYARGQYTRANQRANVTPGRYARGNQQRTVALRGQYSQGNRQPGQYNQGNRSANRGTRVR